MYDAREKAIRYRKWEMNEALGDARREGEVAGGIKGKIEGKIETIRMLQGLLYMPPSDEKELAGMSLDRLEAIAVELQEKLRSRTPS